MNLKALVLKAKETDYKKMFNAKTFLVAGCVTLAAVAMLVAAITGGDVQTKKPGDGQLGNSVLVNSNASADETVNNAIQDGKDYFAVSALNRKTARDEALEILHKVAENPEALPSAVEQALSSIAAMADEMEAEADIETLVKGKGFEDCVAVFSGGSCTVIVRSDGLLAEQVAQILEIAIAQTGLSATDITVVQK